MRPTGERAGAGESTPEEIIALRRPLPASVLVTGASGFLGKHVCKAMVERGITVRGLIRRADSTLAAGVVPVLVSGLDDGLGLRRAVAGAESVVHLAGYVHETAGDAALASAVNTGGTDAVLSAAADAGVRDFVFASSVKAVGESNTAPWTESVAPSPADPYGASKLEGERSVRAAAQTHGFHAPILRLPLVYGPGMKANALRLFDLVERGIPLPLGGIRNRRSLLFTGNLVAAIISTLESGWGGDTFFVSDDADLSTPELITAIAKALNRPARLVPVPLVLLEGAGRLGDMLARRSRFPLTTAVVERLTGSLAVDCSHLKLRAGYAPPYSVEAALRATADWYRGRGS